jgi:hypothetical protein
LTVTVPVPLGMNSGLRLTVMSLEFVSKITTLSGTSPVFVTVSFQLSSAAAVPALIKTAMSIAPADFVAVRVLLKAWNIVISPFA